MLSPHKINVNIIYNLVRPTFHHFEDFDLFKTIDLIDILMKQMFVSINIIILHYWKKKEGRCMGFIMVLETYLSVGCSIVE